MNPVGPGAGPTVEPYALTLAEAAAAIADRSLSPVDLVESVLCRIEAVEPRITAFATVTADLARRQAAAAETELAAGHSRGPLHGIPVGIKDIYETAGIPTTASSAVREGFVPDADSAVVERLSAAGAVMVGKTHTHEFAFGTVTPTTRNPWDTRRIPGGSSGGSGAAVAAGECMVGMGSDTGGSIRIPAALCGTVGLKPTYGRVSRRGVFSLSWSLDHVGPLTRTVRDTALVMNAIAGYDRSDPASVEVPVPDFTAGLDDGVAGLRIGVPTTFYNEHVTDEVLAAVATAVGVLESAGAVVRDVEVPMPGSYAAVANALVYPEAAAYHQQLRRERGHLYGEDLLLRLEIGELVPATDYIAALRARTLIQRAWAELFADLDVLVAPTVPMGAPLVGEREWARADGSTESVHPSMTRLSSPANLTGLPALAVPCGRDGNGMPVSFQVIGRPFDEPTVLRVGHTYDELRGGPGPLPQLVGPRDPLPT